MAELASFMQDIGAWNAVNLDGGGSTTLVVRDEHKNDHDAAFGLGTYRPVANALLAVSRVSYAEITDRLEISPSEALVDTSETVNFSAVLIDEWDYPLPDSEDGVTWELVDLIGEIDSEGKFTPTDYSEGFVVAHHTEFSDSARVEVKSPVSVAPYEHEIPDQFTLHQNYPNPFNPDTQITFDLPESTEVRITVYDIMGRQIAVLADGQHQAGTHSVSFDASNLSSGTYIYEIVTGRFIDRKIMMLLK